MNKGRFLVLAGLLTLTANVSATTATFESVMMLNEKTYTGLGGGRYWSGLEAPTDGSINSAFNSGVGSFLNVNNNCCGGATFWSGFAYSNTTDATSPGFGNQYSAFPGVGADGSENYAVSFGEGATIELSAPTVLQSMMIANTAYSAISMRDGDTFAKKFGGASGDDDDFFELIITGEDAAGNEVSSLSFFLADFRDANNANDYIVDDWQLVDLFSLGAVSALSFSYRSSDVSAGGFINTPTYFALDNLTPVPVPAAVYLFFSAFSMLFIRRVSKKTSS